MADETRKKYRALKAVAVSGIVDIGGIVELTESEAENIGIGTYLEEVDEAAAPKSQGAEGSEEKEPDENGSANAGEGENKSGE